MKRKLADGSEVEELDEPIALIIWTKAPEKWKIIDLENNKVFLGNKNKHSIFSDILLKRIKNGHIGQWKKI